jgi:hypothetical protein
MHIAYFHASKFGNGAAVAEEFRRIMATRGTTVTVQHIRDAHPGEMPPADLYVFSSPGRYGKPIKDAREFLSAVRLPQGTRYALLTTEMAPRPDKRTGQLPSEEDQAKWERVRPIMNELLQAKGLTEVAEEKVWVSAIKGPLEGGWQKKVEVFADRVCSLELQVA